jgi:hypothetical protein
MDRVEVTWTGPQMGAGVSVLHFADGQAAAHLADLHTLLAAVAGNMPSNVSMRIPGSGLKIDPATGAVTGVWTGTAPALVTGAAPTTQAAGVGGRIRWITTNVNWGGVVRGQTFFVPFSTGAYESDGTFLPAVVSALQSAADTFLTATAGTFRVWSRPRGGAGGLDAVPTSAVFVDRVSWLQSRKR